MAQVNPVGLLLALTLSGGLVYGAALALSDCHDGDGHCLVFDPINQSVTRSAKLYLVVILKPVQHITLNTWDFKALSKLLFELFTDGTAKFLPFLQSGWQELKIITH